MKPEKTLKTTIFHWVTVSKPLGQNWIMRYLWKDNIHIFNLTPSGPIFPQYFCPFTNRGQPKNEKMGSCLSISLAVPGLIDDFFFFFYPSRVKMRYWSYLATTAADRCLTPPRAVRFSAASLTAEFCSVSLYLVFSWPFKYLSKGSKNLKTEDRKLRLKQLQRACMKNFKRWVSSLMSPIK